MTLHSKEKNRRPKQLQRVAVLPSLVTLLNAVCGFAAIHFTARGMNDPERLWLEKPELTFFAAAAWMIFLAMVCDGLDGFVARMARSSSSFGGQLDSLADMVSFGVAPAFLMLRIVESYFKDVIGPVSPVFGSMPGKLLWLVAAMYICCTALRLARFNVEHETLDKEHLGFSGLPSPAAAGVVASLVLLYSDYLQGLDAQEVVPIVSRIIIYLLPWITIGVALLMVSRVPYRHVINQYVRGRRSFGHMVWVVALVLFLFWKPQLTMAIVFIAFAATGAVRWVWLMHLKKHFVHISDSAPGKIGPATDAGPIDSQNPTDDSHPLS
jgi:CDP-diacylglycerol---serine O-phosphatidyltransferase